MDPNARWRDAAAELLREAWEGKADGSPGTWFVEEREGLHDALLQTDAQQASQEVKPGEATLASHANHVLYVLRLANTVHGAPAPEGDWEASWTVRQVTPEEWEELKANLEREYAAYRAWLGQNEDWTHELGPIAPLSVVPHLAFHLGQMRLLLRLTAGSG